MATGGNRNWLWFLVTLVFLAVLAIGINLLYNLRIQLVPEKLEAARAKWMAAGPTDYDLEIEKILSAANSNGEVIRDRIKVQIRQGKVIGGTINGEPLPERVFEQYTMPGWFDFVDSFVKRDLAPGAPRTFRSADFDDKTGQILRFRRRVTRTTERQEIAIQLTAPSATPASRN